AENRLGYFALLRNIRNISEQAPKLINEVCKQLTNQKKIRKSLVLPFRLLTAYKQLDLKTQTGRQLAKALSKAIDISCANVPNLKNTLVVVDNSGSMACSVAGSKHLQCNETGALFAMMLAKRSNADVMEFGTTARYIPYRLNESVLEFAQHFARNNQVGHGTNFHAIFDTIKGRYERIVIFSDMQGWIGHYSPKAGLINYKFRYKIDPYVYSFDLAGHGTMQFPQSKVCTLAGFSEKVFDVMQAAETDKRALLKQVEAVEF
ncbi:MAG: TROVE domain-containing protein, partial [Saprospiraceae bacterium]